MERIRNPGNDPEMRPETNPEYREGRPPEDQRLARLQQALGGTALRGAGVARSPEHESRQAAAERVGPLAVRDQTAFANRQAAAERLGPLAVRDQTADAGTRQRDEPQREERG